MQIIPKVRQAGLVCDGKAGSDPEAHPQGGEAGCFPLGKAGFGIWIGDYVSCESFLSVEG